MKRNYKLAAVFSAVLVGAVSVAGCGEGSDIPTSDSSVISSDTLISDGSENTDNSDVQGSESSKQSDNSEDSDPDADYNESEHDLSSAEESSVESSEESIDASQNEQNASNAQNPKSKPEISEGDDFEKLFSENKLDKDYESAANDNVTTEDMVNLAYQYKDLWLAEAENANKQLQGSSLSDEEKQTIQSEYDEWLSGLSDKEREIYNAEKNNWSGGSIYRVNAAEKFKDYCRDYAKVLYEKMYETDGTFEMAYK